MADRGVSSQTRRTMVLGALMVGTGVGAKVLEPKPVIASAADMPDLEAIVPRQFGAWQIDPNIVPLEVSPDVAKTLSTIYDVTVSRTYVHSSGQRIMLSMAYGANQSRALQLHKPEVCYVAQGFKVQGMAPELMRAADQSIPVMRMVGVMGGRVEPITYWMRVGDDVVRGWFEQNGARLRYGMKGLIPDGLLVRVSNISSDTPASYALHAAFVTDMLSAVAPQQRHVLVGNLSPA